MRFFSCSPVKNHPCNYKMAAIIFMCKPWFKDNNANVKTERFKEYITYINVVGIDVVGVESSHLDARIVVWNESIVHIMFVHTYVTYKTVKQKRTFHFNHLKRNTSGFINSWVKCHQLLTYVVKSKLWQHQWQQLYRKMTPILPFLPFNVELFYLRMSVWIHYKSKKGSCRWKVLWETCALYVLSSVSVSLLSYRHKVPCICSCPRYSVISPL